MRVFIVHAHHEPRSFSSALFRQAVQTFESVGHEVATSDLYAQRFDPVSDRRNFTSVDDPDYLKQQREERRASEVNGFAPELEAEIRKLESCDLLVFSFPLWWFAMPAILKGWVDRVFAMRRIYGDGRFYENGLGDARKRAMVIMTVGAGPDAYSGYGPNPSLDSVLAPIEHGVFWFNGFLPLDPFVVWSPARIAPAERATYLRQLDERLHRLDQESPRRMPPLSDFPRFGKDRMSRFMVTVSLRISPDERYHLLVPAQARHLAELKRGGVVLASYMGDTDAGTWRGFILFRERDEPRVREHLKALPLAEHLNFEITQLMQA